MRLRLTVQMANSQPGDSLPATCFARQLISSLVARDDVTVTILGDAGAVSGAVELRQVPSVALSSADASALAAETDAVVQLDPFQPRLVDRPTVVAVHDLLLFDASWAYGEERSALVRTFHKNLIRAGAVVTQFPALLDQLKRIEPLVAEKAVLVNAPLLLGATPPALPTLNAMRRRFDLDSATPTVVCPVAPRPSSSYWNLLSAVHEIERSGRGLRLVAVGAVDDSTWLADLRRRTAYLGLRDVVFSGPLSPADLKALMALATVGVIPGPDDGVWAIGESVDVGTSLACASTIGILAQLEGLGLDVPTFDPADVDETVAALVRAVDDRDMIVGSYAKASATLAERSWDGYTTDLLSVLREVAA